MSDADGNEVCVQTVPMSELAAARAALVCKQREIEELQAALEAERSRCATERKRATDAEAKLTLRELMELRSEQEQRRGWTGAKNAAPDPANPSFDDAVMAGLSGGGAGGAVYIDDNKVTIPGLKPSGVLQRGVNRSRSSSPRSSKDDDGESIDGCWYLGRADLPDGHAQKQPVAQVPIQMSMELPKNNPYVGTFHRAGRRDVRRGSRKISASNLQDWLVSAELKVQSIHTRTLSHIGAVAIPLNRGWRFGDSEACRARPRPSSCTHSADMTWLSYRPRPFYDGRHGLCS
jgi:hypothetical protein